MPPGSSSIVGGTFALSTPLAGTLVVGDPTQTVAITRPGQTARYTFAGTAAQLLRLNWSSVSITGASYVTLNVLKPDGSNLASASISNGATGGLDLPIASHHGHVYGGLRSANRGDDEHPGNAGHALSQDATMIAMRTTMKRITRIMMAAVVMVAAIQPGESVAAKCLEDGGDTQCRHIIPLSDWRHSLCDDWGPYLNRREVWCDVLGGTWNSNIRRLRRKPYASYRRQCFGARASL